ncbi:MAG: CoA ester lyase [Alphaproteobacteria bacterium]|nr:CoA ester lyase [Alphaproteobacteria bacterium]
MPPRADLPTWRSLMFVPVTKESFVAKAHTRGADAIILDLEDSIAMAEKETARRAIPAAMRTVSQAGADVVVRINRPLELAVPDIEAAVIAGVRALMVPKIMGPEHVRLLSEVVAERERVQGLAPGSVGFVGLVETPEALPALGAIAAANPRMLALGVGAEDLSTELGGSPTPDALYVYAMQSVAAARAAGILPLGSLARFADFSDLAGYREGLKRSRALGFACTACIHPSHVPVINEEYGVSAADADRARRLIAAYDAAIAAGQGAAAFEGGMIDLPVVERARRLLARAR